jgi:lipoprotein signal peptidase
MRKAFLFVSIVLMIAAVHAAFSIPVQHLDSWTRHRIAGSAFIHFDYVRVVNQGVAFGLFDDSGWSRVVPAVLRALSAIGLSVLFLSLVDRRYTLQLIALTCIVAPSFVHAGEGLLFGHELDYFQIGAGVYAFPAFNAADVAGDYGWFLLYGLVILRFFRWLPEPRRLPGEEPRFGDPFYDMRKPLRIFLGLFMAIGIPLVLLQSAAVVRVQMQSDGRLAAVFSLAVNAFTLFLVASVWSMIPRQPIDALVLRGFASDSRGWPVMRSFRKSVRPYLRVSGVVDPKESRRMTYFVYWVLMPFVFGIGDMGRANAFRYNVFLTEDWKADLKRLFLTVRFAIFDCRAITPNVAWEMSLAREMLPPERVFFLATSDAAALRKEVAAFSRGNDVELAQCFTVANWRDLSKTLLSQFGHS